jgi:hypothetical protein
MISVKDMGGKNKIEEFFLIKKTASRSSHKEVIFLRGRIL